MSNEGTGSMFTGFLKNYFSFLWVDEIHFAPTNAPIFTQPFRSPSFTLIEESDNLSSNVFSSRLFMIHDAGRCCEDNVAELTGGQELNNPFFKFPYSDVVARVYDSCLVDSASF